MKFIKPTKKSNVLAQNFALNPPVPHGGHRTKNSLKGFAKVLSGGRVVRLDAHKPFTERLIGLGDKNLSNASQSDYDQAILQSVQTNLEAGLAMIDAQELALAKLGGRLSEIALALNNARLKPERSEDEQLRFESARNKIRHISKSTFDHTSLFSNGESKPVTVAVPNSFYWEGLSINRCNLAQPGLLSIDRGKVSSLAKGLILDTQSISLSFTEWRHLCSMNRLQWHLLHDRLRILVETISRVISGKSYRMPKVPCESSLSPLQRPHKLN